jgi:hypothetical protein
MSQGLKHDSEIDLSALFRAIWKTRKLVAVVVLVVAFGMIGLVSFSKLALPTTQTFQHAVRFVFPGVEKGEYPNGMNFAPSDMLASAILQEVYQQNNLDKHGIKPGVFYSSVSVHPYAPSYNAVINRYNIRLGGKKLSFVERQQIETKMLEELKTVSGKSALLRLTLSKRLGISSQLAEKLLHDIARYWAAFSINQRGVLKLPDVLSYRKVIGKNILSKYEPIIIIEILNDEIDRQITRLTELSLLPGANTIADDESGYLLNPLLREMKQFKQYDIGNARAVIMIEKLFTDKQTLLAVLRQRADSHADVEKEHALKAAVIEASLSLYANRQKSVIGQQPGAPDAKGGASSSFLGVIPQLGEGFIDKLIKITKQEEEIEYRQDLVDKYILAKNMSIEAGVISERVRKIVKSLEQDNTTQQEKNVLPKQENNKRLSDLIVRQNQYGSIAGRLFEALSTKRISHNGRLYVAQELSSKEAYSSDHPVLNNRTYTIVFLTTLAAAIFAMFGGLIWQMMSGRLMRK